MLNSETKKHIDNARDVLVGVAPNPMTQVEQITFALIYKFMDDMDQAAIVAGGEPSFFVNELETYAWSRLVDHRIGNQEKMNLYAEALQKFSQASQLPELFRTIFRSAFLPYKSPETLAMFLKEINYFDYSHPEELGNAYEYLLSRMSTQGDAGQFRTPRHIIDFMVDIVNPSKTDKVLDPACGTAGFLVSTYNHILEQHDQKEDPSGTEVPLTPEERKKLMNNLQGFDIDPAMVRISQVNMYLHRFKSPRVFQYDSLTSEEKWGDKFDVILANPPFMSPKGGIKPHQKFSVKSGKSEVLFVDYILNHLKPAGRAAVVVPEGIVIQIGKSYKALRKMLLEEGLYAVVSLPAGVFKPYSGVKTDILFIDKSLSDREEILFLELEHDGFEPGASKAPIEKNDLPESMEVIQGWQQGKKTESTLAIYVSKETISAKGDYKLLGKRYRDSKQLGSQWEIKKLSDVAEVRKGQAITQKKTRPGQIPVIAGGQSPAYFHDTPNREGRTITVSASGAYAGFVNYFEIPIFASDCSTIKSKDESLVRTDFLYRVLKEIQEQIYELQSGGGQPHVYPSDLVELEIPVPPIEIQDQILGQIGTLDSSIAALESEIEEAKQEIESMIMGLWDA